MMIGMALFWLALIIGAPWLVGDGLGHKRQQSQGPLALLDRRFAEGAISIDDYHQRRDILTGASVLPIGAGLGSDTDEGS